MFHDMKLMTIKRLLPSNYIAAYNLKNAMKRLLPSNFIAAYNLKNANNTVTDINFHSSLSLFI